MGHGSVSAHPVAEEAPWEVGINCADLNSLSAESF